MVIFVLAALILINLSLFSKFYRASKRVYAAVVLVLLLKLAIAFYFQTLIYGGFYDGGDTFHYDAMGKDLLFSFTNRPYELFSSLFFPMPIGTEHMYHLTACLYYIMGIASYRSAAAVAALVSSIGVFLYIRSFQISFPQVRLKPYAYMMLFFPSLFFWNSMLLKDPWMFFYQSIATYGAALIFQKKMFKGWLLMLVGGFLAFHIKPYMVVFFAASFLFLIFRMRIRNPVISVLLKAVFFAVALYATQNIYQSVEKRFIGETDLLERMDYLQGAAATGGSQIVTRDILSWGDAIYLPANVMAVLYRPFIFEARNPLMLMAAIENTFLILMTFYCLFVVRKRKDLRGGFYWFAFSYVAIFTMAFSLQVGNLGTMVRQKIHMLPFLFMIFGYYLGKRGKEPEPPSWAI